MSFHRRGLLSAGPSKKRKEPFALAQPKAGEPLSSNRLLAGFMAYEFLTKGTLLGRMFDPSRGEALAISIGIDRSSAQSKKTKTEAEPIAKQANYHHRQSYSELATLLKKDGAHISGIVNPTQLGRWLHK